jgi:hypothetical protein
MTATKMTEQESDEVGRSREAQFLLDNVMLKDALEAIESEWDREWKGSNPADIKTREFAYRMLYTARKFKALLTKIVESGNMAETAHVNRMEQKKLLEEE